MIHFLVRPFLCSPTMRERNLSETNFMFANNGRAASFMHTKKNAINCQQNHKGTLLHMHISSTCLIANSSRPLDPYIRQQIRPQLVQIMGCGFLIRHVRTNLTAIRTHINNFYSRKLIKMSFAKWLGRNGYSSTAASLTFVNGYVISSCTNNW